MFFNIKQTKLHKLLNLMGDIQYGYVNNIGQKIKNISEDTFCKDYKLQSPEELLQSKIGVCWDQCELERYYFDKNINLSFTIYYLESDNKNKMSHTLLVYKYKNKYYWFENSWFPQRGIHNFNNLEEVFDSVSRKHMKHCDNECKEKTNKINWFVLDKPQYGIDCTNFMNHARKNGAIYSFTK